MSGETIFGRIIASIGGVEKKFLFLGKDEWSQLNSLMQVVGAKWSGNNPKGYSPDEQRATFHGLRIYVVDSQQFLETK